MAACDPTILGAGPYELAASNRMRHIKGLDVRVFGEPTSFWKNNMPAGMLLRSNWTATQIADPDHHLTLENYQEENSDHFTTPIPVAGFVKYGKWYQRNSLPDLDRRKITLVESWRKGFRVTLEDGEQLISRLCISPAGI